MGLGADCTVRIGRKTAAGRAHLEGETLLFRGDATLDIPFDRMGEVRTDGDVLVVHADGQELRFELGAVIADRWARLIKVPKGLFEKLEVGPESRVAVVDVHDSMFLLALRERTASVVEGRVPGDWPLIFFGVDSREALRKIQLLRARMVDSGVLWLVRPKGSKALPESEVFEALRAAGLIDTKVVALSKTHTAHKCVVPADLRGQVARQRPPIVSIPPSAPALAVKDGRRPRTAAKAPKKTAKPQAPKRAAAKKPQTVKGKGTKRR